MSLVAYQDSSDESESSEETACVPIVKEPPKIITKKKEPVKITVPAIPEEEEDDKVSIKKKISKSSSMLLGLLPPPKYATSDSKKTSLVPHVLTKKTGSTNNKSPKQVKATVNKKTLSKDSTVVNCTKDSDDESDASGYDFFSLQFSGTETKGISLPPPKQSTYKIDPAIVEPCENPISVASSEIYQPKETNFHDQPVSSSSLSPEDEDQESASTTLLDITTETTTDNIMQDEGFLRLQGKKRGFEEVNLIDVNISEELADKKEYMKSLTEEKSVHSRKKTRMPTSVQKRKHQITYLAYQARERELDLKNQWAQNRLTKRETQAKYGF